MEPEQRIKLPTSLADITFLPPDVLGNRHPGFHPDNLKAGGLAQPDNVEQVQRLLAYCHEERIAVVTQGGLTGLSGAAVTSPHQLILDTRRLNQIESINTLGATAVVQSGVTLAELETAANAHGLTTGIDLAARDTATLGGMAATNAGGIEAFRNGVMRHRVLGLEAVLANGEIYDGLHRVTKANEGLGLGQLFIGAEGTLGVITRLCLSLLPAVPPAMTALGVFKNVSDAVAGFSVLRRNREVRLLSAEAMWPDYARLVSTGLGVDLPVDLPSDSGNLLVLLEAAVETERQAADFEKALMSLYDQGHIEDIVMAKNQRERDALWRIREDSFVVDDKLPHGFWFDISVPLENLAEYSTALFNRIRDISPDLGTYLIAHLGDGNIHATITSGKPEPALKAAIEEAVYSGLTEWGGSFSAEHGIGIDKRQSLEQIASETRLNLMRQVKAVFDPRGIMNPGKVIECRDD